MKIMKLAMAALTTALLAVGCGREDGQGTSSPGSSTQWGEKGITNNVNSVGSTLGPLGATGNTDGLAPTGTAAHLLLNSKSGQPVPPAEQVPRTK
jgi:hypothetical protein